MQKFHEKDIINQSMIDSNVFIIKKDYGKLPAI